MRNQMVWRVVIAAAAFASAIASGTAESGKTQGVRVGLIVDPTVFQSSEVLKFDELRAALGHFLENPESIAEGTEIDVWIVGLGSLASSGPDLRKEFAFDGGALASAHPNKVKDWIKNGLSPMLEKSWRTAHATAAGSSARSCILTSLYRAATYFGERHVQKSTILLVLSDFLEVCDEWGS